MTRPRPDSPAHAFAAEYQRATGAVVEVTWRDAARQWVASGPGSYVEYVEYQLKIARKRIAELEARCISDNAGASGRP